MNKNQAATLEQFDKTNGIIEQGNSELSVLSGKVSNIIIDDSKVIGKIDELRPVISDIAKNSKVTVKDTSKILEQVNSTKMMVSEMKNKEDELDGEKEKYFQKLLDTQEKEIELFLKSEEEEKKKEEEDKKKEMEDKLKEIEMEQKELEKEKAEILKELQ